jgi:AcrR family transcriptional regulator
MQTAVRRRPVQRRSVERFERILDSCAELLDEVGYTGLTTKEVARRAQVPIGTLYQFFPGMDGLLGALALRNLERFNDRLTRRIEEEQPSDVGALVDLAVEEYVAMHRTTPGFGVVDFGAISQRDDHGEEGGQRVLDAVLSAGSPEANPLWAFATGLLADPPRQQPRLALRVALECASAVLRLAFRDDPEGDPRLIAECKHLIRGYLV